MSMVTECNLSDYVDAQDLLTMRKYYGGSVYLSKGNSIFLPQGGSFTDMISSVSSFVNYNKDAIGSIGACSR